MLMIFIIMIIIHLLTLHLRLGFCRTITANSDFTSWHSNLGRSIQITTVTIHLTLWSLFYSEHPFASSCSSSCWEWEKIPRLVLLNSEVHQAPPSSRLSFHRGKHLPAYSEADQFISAGNSVGADALHGLTVICLCLHGVGVGRLRLPAGRRRPSGGRGGGR
ncbi:hypothetical protein VPH35_133486 [Triticum aestivum]